MSLISNLATEGLVMFIIALIVAILLVFSFLIMPGRHFLISSALAVALFALFHVPPIFVLLTYLVLYAIVNAVIFGIAALLLQGKLGVVFRAFGIGGRRGGSD